MKTIYDLGHVSIPKPVIAYVGCEVRRINHAAKYLPKYYTGLSKTVVADETSFNFFPISSPDRGSIPVLVEEAYAPYHVEAALSDPLVNDFLYDAGYPVVTRGYGCYSVNPQRFDPSNQVTRNIKKAENLYRIQIITNVRVLSTLGYTGLADMERHDFEYKYTHYEGVYPATMIALTMRKPTWLSPHFYRLMSGRSFGGSPDLGFVFTVVTLGNRYQAIGLFATRLSTHSMFWVNTMQVRDTTAQKHALGNFVLVKTIEFAAGLGVTDFNLGIDTYPHKLRFHPKHTFMKGLSYG